MWWHNKEWCQWMERKCRGSGVPSYLLKAGRAERPEMDVRWHGNLFQVSEATDEKDLDLAIAGFREGMHIDMVSVWSWSMLNLIMVNVWSWSMFDHCQMSMFDHGQFSIIVNFWSWSMFDNWQCLIMVDFWSLSMFDQSHCLIMVNVRSLSMFYHD